MENWSRMESTNAGRREYSPLSPVEKSRDSIVRLGTKLTRRTHEPSLARRISWHDDPDSARRRCRGGRFAEKIEGRRRRLDRDHGGVGIRSNGWRFYGACVRKQRWAS